MTRSVLLIDCPGVIPKAQEESSGLILRQAIKVGELKDPIGPAKDLIEKTKVDDMCKLYHIAQFKTPDQMLEQVAKKKAQLRAGGKVTIEEAARTVLRDLMNGKIQFCTAPPQLGQSDSDDSDVEMM